MKNIKSFDSFMNEAFDYNEWLEAFEAFLDSTWQEDNEIEIVKQLSEYRDKFKGNAKAAFDYLERWAKENEKSLESTLQTTSEQFQSELDNLIKGVWVDPAGGTHRYDDEDFDLAAQYESKGEEPYKLLIDYMKTVFDEDETIEAIKKELPNAEKKLGDKLSKAEVLILDVRPDGLPWPGDEEFQEIASHKNFEDFKDVINYFNDELALDDPFEWEE